MIVWVKVPIPRTEGFSPPASTRTFRIDEDVRDPSLTHSIGKATGGHFDADGILHVQLELDEYSVVARLAERRGAF